MTLRPHCLLPHPGAARVSVPARGEGFWTSLGLKSHRRSWSALKDDILTLRHWWETGRRSPAPMREDQSQKRKLSLNLADFQKLGDHGYGHGRGDWPYRTPTTKPTKLFSGRNGTSIDVYSSSTMSKQKIWFTAELLLEMMRPYWFLYDRCKCNFKEEQPKGKNMVVDRRGRNVA